jgi:very-short-patch-repair endonuclease
MSDIDRSIHELAARQHGVLSRQQARALGASAKVIRTRIGRGALVPIGEEVLSVSGAPATDTRDAIAAVLDVRGRAALSQRSAAAYWQLGGFKLRPFEVSTLRIGRTATSELTRIHTTTCLPDSHITVVDGLRVTVPVRVLFDLAGRVHPQRLARLIDAAWRSHLVTGRLLRRTLSELAEHGRPGIQLMRQLIEERGEGYRPTDSNLEARFEELMSSMGITSFDRQVDLGGADWTGRVDFIDRSLGLVVEIDSDTFHLSLTDRADDDRRFAALQQAGFVVVRISQFDLWHRPEVVRQTVLEGRASARARRNGHRLPPTCPW